MGDIRRQSILARGLLKSFSFSLAFAGVVSLAISGSPAVTAATIHAEAEVKQFRFNPGGVTGADGVGSNSSDGSRIARQALFGAGEAGYDIFPQAGDGTMAGVSAPLSYAEWAAFHSETSASAGFDLADILHIEGPIGGQAQGTIHFSWQGFLFPNLEFLQDYTSARGDYTITSSARATGTVGNPGILGSATTTTVDFSDFHQLFSASIDASGSFNIPFAVTDAARDISVSFGLGGTGLRGGAFGFNAGTGPVVSAVMLGGAVSPSAGSSFFDISVELPDGLGFKAEGGYFLKSFAAGAVSTPESGPSRPVLAAAVGLICLLRRFAR